MGEIFVENYVIETPIIDILHRVQSELTNGKLSVLEVKGDQIRVTCPVHKDGHEGRPSAYIYIGDGDVPYGSWHCFTCNSSGNLANFIAHCFDKPNAWARQWLIKNFGEVYSESVLNLESIDLSKKPTKVLDESVLDKFESYHPYMKQRKLTDEVIKKFDVKYDPETKSIVFPVRDKNGRIAYLTRRSVESKKFYIDKDADKSNIYLLYNILNNNLDNVYICESQINALTLEGYGYNAIALMGAGCPDFQISALNNTGVKHFILALDNDDAGIKGTKRLCQFLSNDKLVDVVLFKDSRDINDLTREEFDSLKRVDRSEFLVYKDHNNMI